MTTAPTARPQKLPSGEWGALVSAVVAVGDEIRIDTRSGKSSRRRCTSLTSIPKSLEIRWSLFTA